jgi:hypothetical protein
MDRVRLFPAFPTNDRNRELSPANGISGAGIFTVVIISPGRMIAFTELSGGSGMIIQLSSAVNDP